MKKGLAAGVGFAPAAVASTLYNVASRNEKVPLHLPLSSTAVKLITAQVQARLAELEVTKDLSNLDANQAQFQVEGGQAKV